MGELLRVSISKKAIVEYDLAPNLPTTIADAAQLRQVVMNLITNASEALGEQEGKLTLRTRAVQVDQKQLAEAYLSTGALGGRYVSLEVSDTGCGMDEATKARIFDPFFTTKFTGRGLGLAAVLGIVRGHQGAIKVDSTPGAGTTFTVLFPCAEQSVEPAARIESSEARPRDAGGTILVVDDEESVRRVARATLEHAGFGVLLAADGREAVEVFRENAGKLTGVLLDMNMPKMSGEETYQELRRLAPAVPIILTSGYGEQVMLQRFAGQGLAGFIQKPFRLDDLLRKVREAAKR